jgi:hypothetical protein
VVGSFFAMPDLQIKPVFEGIDLIDIGKDE